MEYAVRRVRNVVEAGVVRLNLRLAVDVVSKSLSTRFIGLDLLPRLDLADRHVKAPALGLDVLDLLADVLRARLRLGRGLVSLGLGANQTGKADVERFSCLVNRLFRGLRLVNAVRSVGCPAYTLLVEYAVRRVRNVVEAGVVALNGGL